MSDYGKYPGGHGHSWRGDWHRRMREILAGRGFHTLTDFARSRPVATLKALADEIGVGDVAPIQVQWTLVEEARDAGTLEECARDLLVRQLREVPAGWPTERGYHPQTDVRDQLIEWQGSLREACYDNALALMTRALLDATDIPAGWQPTGPDDPVIVAQFERYWPKPEGSRL